MHTKPSVVLALAGVLGALSATACDLDVGDLNNPGIDELQSTPTAVSVGAACTGLLIGNRRNVAAENGFITQLAILGREAYNFDTADPRYFGELLQGELNQGSTPFGGNFWAQPYANIRLANIILHALDKVPSGELSDSDKAAIRGFVHTIEALDLLEVIVTHDTNGAVIDTDQPIVQPPAIQPLGAIVDRDATYAEIVRLLDAAVPELGAGGDVFPFLLAEGYKGFDTPATFRTFNRAIRARVGAYIASSSKTSAAYQLVLDALAVSFIDDDTMTPNHVIDFDAGVYHTFTTKSGDVTNALINPNIYAHPSLAAQAEANDARLARKTATASKPGAGNGVSATLRFSKLYPRPDSPVPVIRNEELILLRAEALYYTGNVEGALAEINLVRTKSGGLMPVLIPFPPPPNDATFVQQLLNERRYSLMFEGGHRWIDLRRFGQPLPLDPQPAGKPDNVRNVRYPIPLPECNARPGEPRCLLGST